MTLDGEGMVWDDLWERFLGSGRVQVDNAPLMSESRKNCSCVVAPSLCNANYILIVSIGRSANRFTRPGLAFVI